MSEHRYWRRRVVDRVIDQLRRRDSPPRTDREPSRVRGSADSEPAATRRLAPAEPLGATRSSETPGGNQVSRAAGTPPRRQRLGADAITEMLELAHTETQMDMAMLGEVCGGREVVRFLAGDGGSFGLSPGASMSIEDTYCHRLLTGRL